MHSEVDHEIFMAMAYDEALKALSIDEVPIGCVIVQGGNVIGRGFNKRNTEGNALAHAEIIAIHQACTHIGDWRLEGCTIYVTVEPCPMCAGAILQSRLERLVFGAPNKKAGCAGSIIDLMKYPGFNHSVESISGILQTQSAALLKTYFHQMRL